MKKVLLSVMLVFLVVMSGCRLSSLRDPIVPPDDDQDIPETPQPYVVDSFEGYSSATEVEAVWKTTNTHNEITTEKVGKDIEVGQWMTGDIPIDLLAQGLTEIHTFYFIVERNISSEPVSIDITFDEIMFVPMELDV